MPQWRPQTCRTSNGGGGGYKVLDMSWQKINMYLLVDELLATPPLQPIINLFQIVLVDVQSVM